MNALEKIDADKAKEAQKQLATLSKMMAKVATGEKDSEGNRTTAEDVRVQAARVEATFDKTEQGKIMNEKLGIKDVQDDLASEGGFTTGLKNFAGVDSGAGLGKGLKQAFTAERLFGAKSPLASMFGGGSKRVAKRVAKAKAEQEMGVADQNKGVASALGESGLGVLKGKSDYGAIEKAEAEKEEAKAKASDDLWKQKKETAEDTAEAEAETEATINKEQANTQEQVKEANAAEAKRTGQDDDGGIQQEQLETLKEIRDILEGGAGAGGGRNGIPPVVPVKPGLLSRLNPFRTKPPVPGTTPGVKQPGRMARMFSKTGTALKGAGPAAQSFAQGSGGGMMKGALRGASRFGGAIAGVGMGIYEGVTGFKDAEARADAGELTAEEEQEAKGEAIGGGAGGAGGAIAGAAAGAAIGSVVPIVGTVIGGLIGGAVGYFAGRWGGKKAGAAIADAIPVSASELAESNALAETTLKNIEEKDSELVATIRQEAKEVEAQMLEEAGDEVSDNDKAAIKNAALVKTIQNHTAEIDALPVSGGAEKGSGVPDVLSEEDGGSGEGSLTTTTTSTMKGTFSERDLAKSDPEAYAEFQEVKKQFRGKPGGQSRAIMEWSKMGRTEGFGGTLEKTQNGEIVPDDTIAAGGIDPITTPSGQAIENMTDEAGGGPTTNPAPVIVNNTTPAPAPAPKSDEPLMAIMSPTVRTSESVLQRYQDKRFRI
jgi:hypothetical protein